MKYAQNDLSLLNCASSYVVTDNEKHAEVHVGTGKEPEKNLQGASFYNDLNRILFFYVDEVRGKEKKKRKRSSKACVQSYHFRRVAGFET